MASICLGDDGLTLNFNNLEQALAIHGRVWTAAQLILPVVEGVDAASVFSINFFQGEASSQYFP